MAETQETTILAVDIGGSGVKAMLLNPQGEPLTDRERVKTPQPAKPKKVLGAICELAAKLGGFDRVAVGFPGVVNNGVVETAPNLDPKWRGYRLSEKLANKLGKPARVANDATVQGLAAIQGRGVELVITLGTGLGSALFLDGRQLPNLEVAHHPFRKGKTYEELLGAAALKKKGKKKWNKRLRQALEELDHMLNYDSAAIGGGNAKKVNFELPSNITIIPNLAGILGGAALWRDEAQGALQKA